MKTLLQIVFGLVALFIVWHLLMFVIGLVIATAIKIGIILLFCFLIYALFKMMTREKSMN